MEALFAHTKPSKTLLIFHDFTWQANFLTFSASDGTPLEIKKGTTHSKVEYDKRRQKVCCYDEDGSLTLSFYTDSIEFITDL